MRFVGFLALFAGLGIMLFFGYMAGKRDGLQLSVQLTTPTITMACSINGKAWFQPRPDGICHYEDAQ